MLPKNEIILLYADEYLLVVNKPAGLRVIPDGYHRDLPNLYHLLMDKFGKLWVVHRLDRETSGAILIARNADTHRHLNQQFQNRLIKKTYHLLAMGHQITEPLKITYPLRVNGDRAHRTVIDFQKGKPASTFVNQVESLQKDILLLEAEPKTGYTHQIRAHLAAAGYWLLNDPLYFPYNHPPGHADSHPHLPPNYRHIGQSLPIRRIALHSWKIEFFHSVLQRTLQIIAPYPDDFECTITQLQNEGGS
ncbi:pseudouridylate synthases, 23S RNA-specific [Bellilinea caldifistulae]|uniref:RNA pseudouridylate synthase n=1 Tax=Bellilinea caldifistulae TaxID=360411 RepID=A0A0N8GKW1_9CHLR|nr:RluA family pseudouridine synthase [Bellilinea caldifistulae]KPL70802.1 hypothetical protein AC812_16800 [Bellilinea caldifistulae]GAP10921.1 pseudouridylate synthases, 23S RNA-specific [Bellilinea caldifistulae]